MEFHKVLAELLQNPPRVVQRKERNYARYKYDRTRQEKWAYKRLTPKTKIH
jgi:hypothetical protein